MADLATSINLARDARVFVSSEKDPDPCKHNISNTFEVNILSDYSFSQDSNSETISLNEAGCSINRGSQTFNTDLAAVDLSLTTYIRPYFDKNKQHRAIEEMLLNGMISQYEEIYGTTQDDDNLLGAHVPMQQQTLNTKLTPPAYGYLGGDSERQVIDLSKSNVGELLPLQFYFKLGSVCYLVSDVQMESMDIAFDLDSIATMGFSGLGKAIIQVDNDLVEAWTGGLNFTPVASSKAAKGGDPNKPEEALYLNNKLSDVRLLAKSGAHRGSYYSIPITGGNISFTNNISFLVPEELSVVSKPVFGTTGAREITGELTAYLRSEGTTGAKKDPKFTGDLLNDLANDTESVSNEYAMIISIAGCNCRTPRLDLVLAHASLTVPTIQTEDILSTSIAFTAQGANISTADEIELIYYADDGTHTHPCTELPVSSADMVGPIPIDATFTTTSVTIIFDKALEANTDMADTIFCIQGAGVVSASALSISKGDKTITITGTAIADGDSISYFGNSLTGNTADHISVDKFTIPVPYDTATPVLATDIADISVAAAAWVDVPVSGNFPAVDPITEAPDSYRLFGAPKWMVISNVGVISVRSGMTLDVAVTEGVYVIASAEPTGTEAKGYSAESNKFKVTIT